METLLQKATLLWQVRAHDCGNTVHFVFQLAADAEIDFGFRISYDSIMM